MANAHAQVPVDSLTFVSLNIEGLRSKLSLTNIEGYLTKI